jgi:hypothetical protein
MQCLTEVTAGNFQVTSPQPAMYTECTAILVTPTELSQDIFNLSPEQGASISLAILAVWAVGFTIRSAISAVNTNEREFEND